MTADRHPDDGDAVVLERLKQRLENLEDRFAESVADMDAKLSGLIQLLEHARSTDNADTDALAQALERQNVAHSIEIARLTERLEYLEERVADRLAELVAAHEPRRRDDDQPVDAIQRDVT